MTPEGRLEILGIVPARGGSKGVARKNVHPLAGRPLIAWTISAALACPSLDRLVVSTEDAEIARVARQWGAETPFAQPADLAADDVPDLPVCRHALEWLRRNEGYRPDMVVWLRPTAPLRRTADIRDAVAKLAAGRADCLRSVSPVDHHPYWMKRRVDDRLVPFLEGKDEIAYPQRQRLPPLYRLNGAVDATWARTVEEHGFLFGGTMIAHVMDAARSLDIDSELDFRIAEILMERSGHDTTG